MQNLNTFLDTDTQYNPSTVNEITGDGGSNLDNFLGSTTAVKFNSKMTNDQILSNLGYNADDIGKLKTDPVYQLFSKLDGENFMAKEFTEPGVLRDTLRKVPALGAFAHGADQSMFGVAQLMSHAAHSVGMVPETTPALFDALTKLNEKTYQHNLDVKENEYLVPKILGGVAAGLATGGAASAGLAAKGASVGAKVAGVGGVAASGAGSAVALTPTTNVPSAVSSDARDEFWVQKGNDAKAGALWALGLHGLLKGALGAGSTFKGKLENSDKIKTIIDNIRKNGPTESEAYKKVLDELTPLFSKPEYAERELGFIASGVEPSLGDVQGGLVTKGLEKLAAGLPFGLGKFRKEQGEQVTNTANKFVNNLYDKMINTKFSGLDELEEAVKTKGPKSEVASNILQEIKDSGQTPAQVMQTSAEIGGIRKWLVNRKLYAARDLLAGQAYIDTDAALKLAGDIMKSPQINVPGANPQVRKIVGELANFLADNTSVKGYANIEGIIRNLDEPIDKLGKSAGPLIELQRSLKAAQSQFMDNVHKYSKAERYGILAKNLSPGFKAGRGRGYDFKALRPLEANPDEPGVRLFLDARQMKNLGIEASKDAEDINLRSPIVVEGSNGLTEFKNKLKLPDEATDEQVNAAALQYAKSTGHDGVVFTWNGTPRQVIDLTKWKRKISDAHSRATKYYKENLGKLDKQTNKAIVTSNADNILDKAVDRKGVESATRYAKELDNKGLAAVKVATIERAVKLATAADGSVDTKRIARYLHERRDALGVFFKGEDKWALNGFVKLMDMASDATVKSGHGLTGSIMMAESLLDVARSGHPVTAVKNATKTYGSLSAVGKITGGFATNPKLRRLLLAADNAKPGSPKMMELLNQFTTLTAGSTVGKTNGGNDAR